jgi:hypothetical protein
LNSGTLLKNFTANYNQEYSGHTLYFLECFKFIDPNEIENWLKIFRALYESEIQTLQQKATIHQTESQKKQIIFGNAPGNVASAKTALQNLKCLSVQLLIEVLGCLKSHWGTIP